MKQTITSSLKQGRAVWLIVGFVVVFILTGAGCLNPDDRQFPPKPPIPGVERSPALDVFTPGN